MQTQAMEQLKEMQRRAMPKIEPPAVPPREPKELRAPRKRSGFFGGLFSMENDLALVLPLLLLLGREGADDALLLALLYIML